MKTIIAGSRTIDEYDLLINTIAKAAKAGFPITEVVYGGARGVDALGKRWAMEHGIPITFFPADWEKYGKAAGPIRNAKMAEYADALIALWDGESKGTDHMIKVAKVAGIKVFVKKLGEE